MIAQVLARIGQGFPGPVRASLLGCLLVLSGCGGSASDPEPEPDPEPVNPILYEIAGPSGEVEGWVFGTIHALPDDAEWVTDANAQVIEDADTLIVEVADLGTAEVGLIFNRLGTTDGIGPLSLRVDRELRPDLDRMIEASEIPAMYFHSKESWAAAILLSRVGAVGSPENGVDRTVLSSFANRTVIGLETAEEQLGIFDTLSQRDQRDLLEGTIEEWLASKDNPGQLTKAWLAGDEAALIEATSRGIMADPELRSALLVDRNARWLPVIEAQLENAPRPLIAVGAGHVVGPDGLPAMLKAAGYTVRRIETPPT